MEKSIKVKPEYSSLDKLIDFLKSESPFGISKEYDHWDVRTDANGQMEQCVVIKKSNMHGAKAYFENENTLKVDYIIPNKMMNAYFGKSQKSYKNVLEIIAGKVKSIALENSQKKAFEEVLNSFTKISV